MKVHIGALAITLISAQRLFYYLDSNISYFDTKSDDTSSESAIALCACVSQLVGQFIKALVSSKSYNGRSEVEP